MNTGYEPTPQQASKAEAVSFEVSEGVALVTKDQGHALGPTFEPFEVIFLDNAAVMPSKPVEALGNDQASEPKLTWSRRVSNDSTVAPSDMLSDRDIWSRHSSFSSFDEESFSQKKDRALEQSGPCSTTGYGNISPSRIPPSARLEKEEVVALQTDLLHLYSLAPFQRKLNELRRKSWKQNSEYEAAVSQLISEAQLEIIPKYGFQCTAAGIASMLECLKEFKDDPDIFCLEQAIQESLSFEVKVKGPPMTKADDKPYGKGDLISMLQEYLISYRRPRFQAYIEDLKRSYQGSTHERAGYFKLPGRAELAFKIQKVMLPLWGFESSSQGVLDMIQFCKPYLHDPEVIQLFDAINSALGMSPDACKRFRSCI